MHERYIAHAMALYCLKLHVRYKTPVSQIPVVAKSGILAHSILSMIIVQSMRVFGAIASCEANDTRYAGSLFDLI